jgi:HAD superfamily hydrolase (TIGR01490 family)
MIKAAFFDLDGTLLDGFIICSFPHFLYKKGLFSLNSKEKIDFLFEEYKKGKISYSNAALKIPKEYAKGLKHQNQKEIIFLSSFFMSNFKKNIFSYSKSLVQLMKKKGFRTIAISGSPIEAINNLKFLGFQNIYGTELEVINEIYTGKLNSNLVLRKNKKILFHNTVSSLNIDLSSSFAFGDTAQDLPMLKSVKYPFAVNPDNFLKKEANNNFWPIVNKDNILSEVKKTLKFI